MINEMDGSDFATKVAMFNTAKPFNHLIIDNFLNVEDARLLSRSFPKYDDPIWKGVYNNPLEIKKTCQSWSDFSPPFYKLFHELASEKFISALKIITRNTKLYVDHGLHGGGLHAHGPGGKLNVHLDYNIHPKLGLQRKLNLILYLNEDWQEEWGGHLSLWSHNDETFQPKECVARIAPIFNRAVIFDTTQNSWHGLPEPITCPPGKMRQSAAVYYLTDPPTHAADRSRALFAPHGEQANDPKIIDLIQKRVNGETASSVYVTGDK